MQRSASAFSCLSQREKWVILVQERLITGTDPSIASIIPSRKWTENCCQLDWEEERKNGSIWEASLSFQCVCEGCLQGYLGWCYIKLKFACQSFVPFATYCHTNHWPWGLNFTDV